MPTPNVLIQVLDTVTVPSRPGLLAVKATLADLCAYSASFVPPDALEELTAYLLSWAASAVPFQPLTAEHPKRAAASDTGAHRAAELLLERRLEPGTACPALLEGLCDSLTRRARHPAGAHLVSSVFLRLLATMPLRLLVILLGRLLPLLQSTAVPGVPLLQASGRSASGKPVAASLMHHGRGYIGQLDLLPYKVSRHLWPARVPSSFALPSQTCATSTLGVTRLRIVRRMATLALRLAPMAAHSRRCGTACPSGYRNNAPRCPCPLVSQTSVT